MREKPSSTHVSRRRFLRQAAAGLAAVPIVPSYVLGRPFGDAPSDKIDVACIGIGGRGRASVDACAGQNIVGLCDVDERQGSDAWKTYPRAKRFKDFRKMLDELDGSIDAVTVGIPDHTHAVAAIDAIRRKKHVYCEKPLAHSIGEVRALMKAARENKVITQLGNQGHSFDSIRTFVEWIGDGAIGNVSEIHACCDAFPDVYCQIRNLPKLSEKHDVPKELDYDLWLGPVPFRPYSPMWVPWNWRGWMPFGTGCLGDWVCHVVDPVLWALDLGLPETVRAEPKGYDPKVHGDVYPPGAKIAYGFPAKGKRGPVKLVWFDGNQRPPRPEGVDVPGTGAVVHGDKGIITYGSHGAHNPQIFPLARRQEYKLPAQSIPRVPDHHWDWLEAIRKGRPAGSNFEYGGTLTEIGLLGAVAIRFPGEELKWDAAAMRFTNNEAANGFVAPPFREGWKL